jgi:6-phosphofructokinase 1
MKKIAILCSGGDVSGMNAALKRFVEYALHKEMIPYFIYDGYEGLIEDTIEQAQYKDVSGIISQGGTIIGTSRSERFLKKAFRKKAIDNLNKRAIGGVIILGGDGSFKGMQKISLEAPHIRFSGIPATIDNDIAGTEYSLGVDTALNIIKYAIDAIRDTASSFKRAFIIETMGRECGYLALVSALTSGAEMCLIPEREYDLKTYEKRFRKEINEGRSYFIAVLSEAMNKTEEIKEWFEATLGIEARIVILGHIQRGGNPTVHDRLMASHFITYAINGLIEGVENRVVCYNGNGFGYKHIQEVAFKQYKIPKDLLGLML